MSKLDPKPTAPLTIDASERMRLQLRRLPSSAAVAVREFIRRHKLLRLALRTPIVVMSAALREYRLRRQFGKEALEAIRRTSMDRARSMRCAPHTKGTNGRVVFLNDVGFRYGAGIAQKRQASSFLLKSWDVSVVAWRPAPLPEYPSLTGDVEIDAQLSIHGIPRAQEKYGRTIDQIEAEVTNNVASLRPDVIIVGNVHGAAWPMGIMRRLRELDSLVIAYMHDCYWLTGRCAYPGSCSQYLTGCDARCPTAEEYPSLPRDKIASAWRSRSGLFMGPGAIPLVANSKWTRDVALSRFPSARTEVVHLGLDHELFKPMPKPSVRRLLGLPLDKPIVAIGAIDVDDRRKGGPIFLDIHRALMARDDVALIIVGKSSTRLCSAKSFGLVEDERLMPLILNAADVYVSSATDEAFGQMLLECSACAVPTVAFDVGGISEVVNANETGVLIKEISAAALLNGADRLLFDHGLCQQMGQRARERVENYFTLVHQGERWMNCIGRLSSRSAA